ncbi:MAG: glutathione synthase, partial [Pseudomonadota bacterium]
MSFSLGVVMDPIDKIKVHKDTTLTLLLAAKAAGWSLFYMELSDLYLDQHIAMATMRTLDVYDDQEHWYQLGEREIRALGELDTLLMRKDPPF